MCRGTAHIGTPVEITQQEFLGHLYKDVLQLVAEIDLLHLLQDLLGVAFIIEEGVERHHLEARVGAQGAAFFFRVNPVEQGIAVNHLLVQQQRDFVFAAAGGIIGIVYQVDAVIRGPKISSPACQVPESGL